MAIFNKRDEQSISSTGMTIVAQGANFEGVLKCTTRLHIDGEVKGKIDSSSVVVVGKSGKFYGNIKSKKLILSGLVEGDIDCDSVELLTNSVFKGTVISAELMIEAKAKFDGENKIKVSNTLKKNEGKIN